MAEEETKNSIDIIEINQTDQKLEMVKGVIRLLFMAAKNHTIYPEDHAINQDSIKAVVSHLDPILKKYGDLRFYVDNDRLIFEDETVYQDDPKRDKLAFPLFRDGIQWMEFQEGIEVQEIYDFVKIFNQYKKLQDEPQGDLVTALWEKDMPHMRYAATDVLWNAEVVKDYSTFSQTGAMKQEKHEEGVEHSSSHETMGDYQQDKADMLRGRDIEGSTPLEIMDRTIWKMTSEESKRLEEMVAEEETQSSNEDVFDILWLILSNQDEPEDYGIILEFMKEEFKDTLAQGEFRIALDFLVSLKKTYQSSNTKKAWAQPLLRKLFFDIATPQVLEVVKEVLPSLDKQRIDQVKYFRKLFLCLPPVTITVLAPLLMENLSGSLKQHLMEIIESLARKDSNPLEQLLNRSEEDLVKKIVCILGHIDGEKPIQILIRMTHHSSGWVRLEALKALETRNKNMIEELFHLINDPVLIIRRLMWNHLEQYKNEKTGNLILDYLQQEKIIYRDDQQIFNCFKTLSCCNTISSAPFLGQSLLGQRWNFGSERSLRRQAAAIALFELNTQEAQDILKKASRSLFPSVRSAYHKALKDYQ